MVGCFKIQLLLLSVFLLSSFWIQPSHAIKKSYIVYLGAHSHGPNPTSADLDAATNSHYSLLGSLLGSPEKAQEAIFYSYNKNINGFAAELEEEEAAEVAKHPNVVSVFPNIRRELHTTHSWDFLGLESNGVILRNSSWVKAKYGEDTIIANLDTGVWPESKSFSDGGIRPVPRKWHGKCEFENLHSNKTHCNRKLIGARFFVKGFEAYAGKINASFYTTRDIEGHGSHTLSTAGGNFVPKASVFGSRIGTAKGGSPRARVAAYKVCWPAINGIPEGGCFDADILAGFEAAISDGVDVISASIGGDAVEFLNDPIAIGSFHAVAKGIVVVSSAGNSGPTPGSVSNVAPWIFTIAASTIDREFDNYVALGNRKHIKALFSKNFLCRHISALVLEPPRRILAVHYGLLCSLEGSNKEVPRLLCTMNVTWLGSDKEVPRTGADPLAGASLSSKSLPSQKFYPLVTAEDARLPNAQRPLAKLCYNGTLDPQKVKGKILLCLRGKNGRIEKGEVASLAGAVGMILANDAESMFDTTADPHVLPASHISYEDGEYVFSYINKTKNPMAYMTRSKTVIQIKPAPTMAAFSSRGPSTIQPAILKPDITAPGVNIIAAYSEALSPTDLPTDKRRSPFGVLSGTSMSCPHVSGIVGLLKTLHPRWSPAAIKSAIMTSASTINNSKQPILDSTLKQATPFAYGAGHVQPDHAMEPGLVYDLTLTDYLNFLCDFGYNSSQLKQFFKKPFTCPKSYSISNFNYPSISVPMLGKTPVKVRRTVTNVGPPSTYSVDFKVSARLKVSVRPKQLTFKKVGEKKSFTIVLEATAVHKPASYDFGQLWWSNGKNIVRSPIVVKYQ